MTLKDMTELKKKIYDIVADAPGFDSDTISVEFLADILLMAGEIDIFYRDVTWNADTEYAENVEEAGVLEYNCSDVFMWGCSDSETLTESDIRELYKVWKTGKKYATMLWVCQKRNQRPQDAWKEDLVKAGVWDEEWERLPDHPMAHV